MRKQMFILVLFVISNITLSAQRYINEDVVFENFTYSVKQISEFMRRFNLQEVIVQPEQDSAWRYTNRIFLFDKETYLKNQEKADEMIAQIEKKDITINFKDTSWYAIVNCNVLFQGRKDSLILILKPEKVKDDVYKWSIIDVHGSIVELSPISKNEQIKISPVDNEMKFMSLSSITRNNATNIVLFSRNEYEVDRLTAFNAYVYAGMLKVQNVKKLTYRFLQINGFEFFVDYFNREDKNSGWLISHINKLSEMQKDRQFLQEEKSIDAIQIITNFYEKLSLYALNPENPTLAKHITSLFIEPDRNNAFFGVSSIYDDVDYFINNYPEAMVSINTYLAVLENPINKKLALKFIPKEIKQIRGDQNTKELSYILEIYSNTNKKIKYTIPLVAAIKGDKIINIGLQIQQ